MNRWLLIAAGLAVAVGCSGMRFEPLGTRGPADPTDPAGEVVSGEHVPVPALESNPLDPPNVLRVVCNPQGRPLVATPEVEECQATPECRIVCD